MCIECHQEKSAMEFYKRKNSKDGLRNICKNCYAQNSQQHYSKHKEEILLKHKQYKIEHKKEIKIYMKQWYAKNREETLLQKKQYNSEHKEENKLSKKKWRSEHKEEIKIKDKKYRAEHKNESQLYHQQYNSNPIVKKRHNDRHKERTKTDATYVTTRNLRARNNAALKSQGVKKTMHTLESLGCTALEFQTHMISNFKPGMTKENNGKRKWVQHHIIGFDDVDLHNIEQLKKVCHYTNIIPMWEDEHIEWHKTHRR